MVESSSISITPAQHADNHQIGGSDPLTGTILVSPHHAEHESGGSDVVPIEYPTGIISSNDTVKTHEGATGKFKETTLTTCSPTLRISYEVMKTGSVGTPWVRIYRNAGAVGTQHNVTSGTYSTKNEEIAGWSNGDALQIYAASSAGDVVHVKNLRVYVVFPTATVANDP